MKKALKTVLYTICILAWAWFILSFIDVNIHNVSHEQAQKMNKYNLFVIMERSIDNE